MDKQENTKKRLSDNMVSIIVAAVIAVCFVVSILGTVKNQAKLEYDIVILGDSVMGKERIFTTVDSRITEITGKSVYNGAFGGSCASTANYENKYDQHEDSLNLCRMIEAVCTQDFGVQLSDLPNNQFSSWYFVDSMQQMAKIDYDKTDVLVLQHGINDYGAGRPVDNPQNKKDISTYAGAMRYSIERVQETYPDMQIILVTPTFCWIVDYEPCDEQSFGCGTMEEYARKTLEIAEEYDLGVIDVYHELGIDRNNITEYTEDGMHLNEQGRMLYGDFLGNKLQQILQEK